MVKLSVGYQNLGRPFARENYACYYACSYSGHRSRPTLVGLDKLVVNKLDCNQLVTREVFVACLVQESLKSMQLLSVHNASCQILWKASNQSAELFNSIIFINLLYVVV